MKGKCYILQLLLLWLDSSHGFYTYYFILGLHARIYLQHKNNKQHIRGTIWHTGCEHWTREQFEGQVDRWEWDWFPVGYWPLLLWLSWLGTVSNKY